MVTNELENKLAHIMMQVHNLGIDVYNKREIDSEELMGIGHELALIADKFHFSDLDRFARNKADNACYYNDKWIDYYQGYLDALVECTTLKNSADN